MHRAPTPPAGAYPIVTISYLLFYGQNNGVHLSDKQTLIKFVVSPKATAIVKKLEYAPLALSINKAVLNALNGPKGKAPCLQ